MTKSIQLIGLTILVWAVAVVFLSLRFYSHYSWRQRLLIHDYLNLIGFTFSTALAVCAICNVIYGGLGESPSNLADMMWKLPVFGKLFIATQLLWVTGVTFLRISVLYLYMHLFSTAKWYRITCHITKTVAILWALANVSIISLACRPLAFNWDKSIPNGQCIQKELFYIINNSFNLGINIAIALLPIPVLCGLQIRTATKAVVMFMFVLGALICSASATRIALYRLSTSYDHFLINSTSWILHICTVMEPLITCALASIPLIRSARGKLDTSLFQPCPREAVRNRGTVRRVSTEAVNRSRGNLSSRKYPFSEVTLVDPYGRDLIYVKGLKGEAVMVEIAPDLAELQSRDWEQEMEEVAPKKMRPMDSEYEFV